jgi:hypothetical protein
MARRQVNLRLRGQQTLRFAVSEIKTNLNYLGALGRLRLADRLVEPDLISEWVHHGKGAITPVGTENAIRELQAGISPDR